MEQQIQDKAVEALAAVPFITVAGVNFMTLNEVLETATLILGFVTGIFALFFQVRRWYRGRRRDRMNKL